MIQYHLYVILHETQNIGRWLKMPTIKYISTYNISLRVNVKHFVVYNIHVLDVK